MVGNEEDIMGRSSKQLIQGHFHQEAGGFQFALALSEYPKHIPMGGLIK